MPNMTLEEVARLSGVSRSTVSRVINNHPRVSPDVRRRVAEVIAQTGYQPDQAARSLVSRRSRILGLVIPRAVQALFTDAYYALLLQGVAQGCNASDYTLSLYLLHSQDEEEKLYPRVLRPNLIDGVIVTGSQVDDPLVPRLRENGMPFVMIGRPGADIDASYIDADNTVGARQAVEYLIRLGRRRVAAIAGPQTTTVGIDRLSGYLDAVSARGQGVENGLIAEADFTEEGGYHAMRRLIDARPDAVFAASDTMAFGALRALRECGLRAGQDVAVVGFDDVPAAVRSDPPLTTVRQPIRRQGSNAVEILIDIVQNGPIPARRVMLSTDLVIRASCGAHPVMRADRNC